jgi:hypothetical protein
METLFAGFAEIHHFKVMVFPSAVDGEVKFYFRGSQNISIVQECHRNKYTL